MFEEADTLYMKEALKLAGRGRGKTSPNPMVGAVLVKDGRIVGRGYHRSFGAPHAEAEAIGAAGSAARGSTLYVSLEPCCHYGHTPPCTDAIIGAGIERVVAGVVDPNPVVNGRGLERLRSAGIDTRVGLLEKETRSLNRAYFKYHLEGLPYVVLKIASTADGRIAARGGESQWITGDSSRRKDHRLRAEFDAVLVGKGTVRRDDPTLTVRHVKGRSPRRVILDSGFSLELDRKVFRDGLAIWAGVDGSNAGAKLEEARAKGVDILELPGGGDGRVDLEALLRSLAAMGILSVLVEGGGKVVSSFIKTRLADELCLFLAPAILGGEETLSWGGDVGVGSLREAVRLRWIGGNRLGEDFMLRGVFRGSAWQEGDR